MTELITSELVALDANLGSTKEEVIRKLAEIVAATGRAEADGLERDALKREEQSATGMGDGIAIPHCRSTAVNENALAFARLDPPVDFGGFDGPADLAFMIAASEGSDASHLDLLAKLARNLVRAEFVSSLREAKSAEEIVALVTKAIAPEEEAAEAVEPVAAEKVATDEVATDEVPAVSPASSPSSTSSAARDSSADSAPISDGPILLAVTACPTGIAHTFMAADALEQAARAAGVRLHVEPQGSGSVTPIPADVIAKADAVIFATDVGVRDRERFTGLPVVEAGVKKAIHEGPALINEAVAAAKNPNARKVDGGAEASAASSAEGQELGWPKRIQQAIMTGVSYMIPFVAAGGLLIALGFALGGYNITDVADKLVAENSLWNLPEQGLSGYLGAVLFKIGATGMGFLVAALSGYTAYALAGRPGIAPGFIGGAISVAVGAGFIGGLITGLIAGLVSLWLTTFNPPRWLAGLMPVVVIPLISSLVTGGAMYLLLGRPIADFMTWLNDQLTAMSGSSSAVLLGLILGLMMCFDLGGPVNKAAYLFATAGLSAATTASFEIMAAVMISGMVPPLAMALSSTVRPQLYSEVERENGRSAWLLGASFISEGAIPFAAADPLRVIPAMMAGGAVTGMLSMAFHVGSRAPHGGIFVLFAIENVMGFFIALVVGTAVAAAIVTVLKATASTNTADVAPAA